MSRFADLTRDALRELPDELQAAVADAELVIDEVPPEPSVARPDVPLAVVHLGGGAPRVTVYRRPLESRALDRAELTDLLRAAIGRQIAEILGIDLADWDDPDLN